jgi:hypothetical protein
MMHKIKKFILGALKPLRPYGRRLFGAPEILLEEMPNAPELFKHYRMLLQTGHVRVPGGWLYGNEFYPDYITVGGNSLAIQRTALKYCRGRGLDIGANYWPLKGSTPIDNERGLGLANTIEDIPPASQDYVFSSHCLEHIEHWEDALDVWASKIKVGGHLFLYLPHPLCKLWHKSNPLMSDTHKWVPEPSVVIKALRRRRFTIVDKDEGPDSFFSFFVCGRKRR